MKISISINPNVSAYFDDLDVGWFLVVSVECIGKGVAKFADREILKNVDGWRKVVVGAAIALAINRSRDIAASYRENSVVKMLKIFDDTGNVDIDILREVVKDSISNNGFVITVPILGELKFHKSDIDNLYNDIMSNVNGWFFMATEATVTMQKTMTKAEFLDMLHECFVDEIHDAKKYLGYSEFAKEHNSDYDAEVLIRIANDEESHARYLLKVLEENHYAVVSTEMGDYQEMERLFHRL